MEYDELFVEVPLCCGCRMLKALIFGLMGKQILKGKPILCPIHNVPHDYAYDAEAQKVAAGMVARIEGIDVVMVTICGVDYLMEVHDDQSVDYLILDDESD